MMWRTFTVTAFLVALILLAPAVLAQDEPGVPASDEDASLFSAALSGIAAESSYGFDIFLDTELSATGMEVAITVEGEGVLDVQGSSPALALDLRGRVTSNGEEAPVNFGLRIKDGILYVNNTGATESDGAQWIGVPLDAAPALINASLLVQSGQSADALLQELGTQLNGVLDTFAASGIPPESFLSLIRLPDGVLDGFPVTRLVLNVDPAALALADNFASFLNSLPSDPSSPPSEPVTEADVRALAAVLEQTLIQLKVRIDPASSVFRSGEFVVDSSLDPAVIGENGDPIRIVFDLLLSLKDIGREQVVNAPVGASIMSEAEISAALSASTQPTQAVVFAFPTPTPGTGKVTATPPPPVDTPEPRPTSTPSPIPASATPAPTERPPVIELTLVANEPLGLVLPGDAPLVLNYAGTRGELITVSARSLNAAAGIDPTVELLDSNGVRLGFNDDLTGTRPGFGTLDSVIPDVKLPADGTYQIVVNTFAPGVTGPVEVLVSTNGGTVALPSTPVSGSDYPIVTVDQRSVPSDGADCITLDLLSGEQVTVAVRALDAALDPAAELSSPNGAQLAFNDDQSAGDPALGRFDSLIEAVPVPESGAYDLCVSGFAGSAGAYELTVTRAIEGSVTQPTPAPTVAANSSGDQVIRDEVPVADTYQTSIEAQAGDVYTITVRSQSDTLDPQLGIFFENEDALLFYSDDHGTSAADLAFTDSQIVNAIFDRTGTYDILIAGYEDSGGPFEMTIARVATGAPLGAPTVETVSGKLQANSVYTYDVDLPEGAYVTFTVAANDDVFDPQLTLIGPDGVVAADNDDHSSEDESLLWSDSRIRNFFVAVPGTYSVEIRGYQGSGGPFTLTIETRQ